MKAHYLLGCIAAGFFSACTQPTTVEELPFAHALLGDTSALFRGLSMGATPAQVASDKWHSCSEVDQGRELACNAWLTLNQDSVRVKVAYSFDELGLFEVQCDLFPPDSAATRECYDLLKAELDKRYGHSPGGYGYSTWQTVSATHKVIDIALLDESPDYGKPFLSLNYFEPLTTEY